MKGVGQGKGQRQCCRTLWMNSLCMEHIMFLFLGILYFSTVGSVDSLLLDIQFCIFLLIPRPEPREAENY